MNGFHNRSGGDPMEERCLRCLGLVVLGEGGRRPPWCPHCGADYVPAPPDPDPRFAPGSRRVDTTRRLPDRVLFVLLAIGFAVAHGFVRFVVMVGVAWGIAWGPPAGNDAKFQSGLEVVYFALTLPEQAVLALFPAAVPRFIGEGPWLVIAVLNSVIYGVALAAFRRWNWPRK